MLKEIQACFRSERILFTKHARDEMEEEKFGEITEREVFEAVQSGKVIETYPKDEPYPSCLIYPPFRKTFLKSVKKPFI